MGINLGILDNPKVKALVTGAFLLGGIVFSLLTYFMLVSSKPQPVEITYNCASTLGAESTAPVSNISTPSPESPLSPVLQSLVNINTATQAQLESLPGIGPAFAKRIVEYRGTNGNFTSTQELMRVKGVGQKTYEELKDFVTTK